MEGVEVHVCSSPSVLGRVLCEGERGGEEEEEGREGAWRGEIPRFLFRLLARGARATSPRVKPAFVACSTVSTSDCRLPVVQS